MKINKKQLIIWGVVVVVLILGGIAFYQYSPSGNVNKQDNTDSIEELTKENNPSDNKIGVEAIVGESDGGVQGGIIVCAYKCGDGVCQSNVQCESGDMNCICVENVQECPEDCSN